MIKLTSANGCEIQRNNVCITGMWNRLNSVVCKWKHFIFSPLSLKPALLTLPFRPQKEHRVDPSLSALC